MKYFVSGVFLCLGVGAAHVYAINSPSEVRKKYKDYCPILAGKIFNFKTAPAFPH